MTATRTDVPLLDLDVLRSIEWPEGYDAREILYLFGHSAWPQRNELGTAYRRWLCEEHPLNFALTYLLPFFADQVTRRISFAGMHMDMFLDMTRWVGPGPTRRVTVAGREGGKSTLYYLVGPLFNGAFAHHRLMAAFSYTDKQASGNHLRRLRGVLEGSSVCSELLLSDFPDLVPTSKSGGRLVLRNGVTIACAGLGSNVVGLNADTERPGIILGDDLLPADRTNPDNIAAIKQAILASIMPLGRRAHIRLFGTVFQRKDLMDDAVRLCEGRPAISPDRGRWLTGQHFEPVYYRPDWPQRWPIEELLAERAADPHTFALRYAPHLLDQAEAEAYWTTETWVRNPMFPTVRRIISVDHAVSGGRKADYTAISVLGVNSAPIGTPTRRVGVEHVEQGRMGIPQIRQRVWDLYRQIPKHKPDVLLWERNQGGDSLAQEVRPIPEGMKLITWHAAAVKAQRIIKLHKQCVSGQVVMVGEHPEFEGQAEAWDPRATKDDMLDAVGSGARLLLTGKAEM